MRWPIDNVQITQGFRANPNKLGYGPFGHTGIDLAASVGTPIHAAVTGNVIAIGTDPNYEGGLYVIVRQDGGDRWETYTGHMSRIDVTAGQHVQEGQQIGLSGQTGQATGPHVHFQVRHYGAGSLVDPAELITTEGDETMTEDEVRFSILGVTGGEPMDTYEQEVKYWTGRDPLEFSRYLYGLGDNYMLAARKQIDDLKKQLTNNNPSDAAKKLQAIKDALA